MDFAYYPGCSLHATASEYDDSVQAVFTALNVGLQELDDWNCCGASSAHCVNHALSLALPARNLALAQHARRDVMMPCAACFNRHKSAEHALRTDGRRRASIEEAVGFEYTGVVSVRSLLDIVGNEIGLPRIQARVARPLDHLPVVAYYGCLLVRPPEITQFENSEHPTLMGQVLDALGAAVCPWSYATECCGGALSLTKPNVAARLVRRLAERAREAGAEAMVTSCPLCQVNLEMRQSGSRRPLPTFYFTELMGLAFDLPQARNWWPKHLIDPRPLLQDAGLYV